MGIGHWAFGHWSIINSSSSPAPPASPASSSLLPHATNPERKALTAAWVRSSAHSLFRILRT
jgi:hypothetical protein